MEYPFKDLLPLDEVLEREGYYKDWTHLDPKVFYSLTQISEYIKTKGFGVDVRLLIAQLAEHFSLKTLQINEIEQFFSDVMVELADDKDFYSLPEIAGARRGYKTLIESLNNLSFNMFNPNLGKITPNMISDELLAQIAGTAAVNAVPADGSLTTPKYAPKSITPDKTSFYDEITITAENLAQQGKPVSDANSDGIADGWAKSGSGVTDPRVESGRQYWTPTNTAYSSSMTGYIKGTNVKGDIYYYRFEQKNVGNVYFTDTSNIILNNNSDGVVSGVFEAKSSITNANVFFYPRVANVESFIGSFVLVNLSALLGRGKETSLEVFEGLLNKNGVAYFESVNLSNPKNTFIKSALDVPIQIKGLESDNVSGAIEELSNRKTSERETTFFEQKKNKFNKNDVVSGGYFSSSNGGFNSNSNFKSYKVDFKSNAQYANNLLYKYEIALFDNSDTFVGGIASGWTELVTPDIEGITYGYVVLQATESPENTMIIEGDSLPLNYIEYGYRLNTDYITPTPTTQGKNGLFFGDSITETATISEDGQNYQENTRSNWPRYIANLELGVIKNYARSGATYRDQSVVGDRRKSLKEQVSMAIDRGEVADIVVVSLGTNDGTGNLGTYETAMSKEALNELDTSLTLEAARWAFWKLREKYPDAVFYCGLPIQRAAYEPPTQLIDGIRRMAERYNFIVIDATKESGIVRDFEVSGGSGRDLSDGLHPNVNGQVKMAKLYSRVIMNTIGNHF